MSLYRNFLIEGWEGDREFPLDMAGFAFSLSHFREVSKNHEILMPYRHRYEEEGFLKQLEISRRSMEILSPDKVICLSYQDKYQLIILF